jgi:hypothetical protein
VEDVGWFWCYRSIGNVIGVSGSGGSEVGSGGSTADRTVSTCGATSGTGKDVVVVAAGGAESDLVLVGVVRTAGTDAEVTVVGATVVRVIVVLSAAGVSGC